MIDNRKIFTEEQEATLGALIRRKDALERAAAGGDSKAQELLPKVQVLLEAHLRRFKLTSSYFAMIRSGVGNPFLAFSADLELFRDLMAIGPFGLN